MPTRLANFMENSVTRLSPPIKLTKVFDNYDVPVASKLTFSGKSKSRKRVRFHGGRNLDTVYQIEPFLVEHNDLWWSQDELNFFVIDQTSMVSDKIQNMFAHLYRKARAQVYFELRLDHDLYHQLLVSKQNGYDDGFGNWFKGRQKHITNTVASIVKAQQSGKNSNISKYASSLTKADALWAMYMARVDAEVVAAFYSETNNNDNEETNVKTSKTEPKRRGLYSFKLISLNWKTSEI